MAEAKRGGAGGTGGRGEALLRSAAPLLASGGAQARGGGPLATGKLSMKRLTNLNEAARSQSIVSAVQWHPNGQMAMASGMDKVGTDPDQTQTQTLTLTLTLALTLTLTWTQAQTLTLTLALTLTLTQTQTQTLTLTLTLDLTLILTPTLTLTPPLTLTLTPTSTLGGAPLPRRRR